jgi:hypothetical protein
MRGVVLVGKMGRLVIFGGNHEKEKKTSLQISR